MSEKALKFDNTGLNKKNLQKSKEPIDLLSVHIDQIFVSNIIMKLLSILLITKKVKLLNHYALFYLK